MVQLLPLEIVELVSAAGSPMMIDRLCTHPFRVYGTLNARNLLHCRSSTATSATSTTSSLAQVTLLHQH